MKRYRRTFLWAAGGLGALLLALLFTLTVVAPRVISSESIKTRIRNEFSKAVGGTLDFDRLRISLFPRPGVVVHGASITIPETGHGTFESVRAYPWILPLFRGNVHIGKLRIEQPTFELDLANIPDVRKKTESGPSRSLDKKAASLLEALASKVPDLEVDLEGGRLELLDKGKALIRIQDLDANVLLPPAGPKVRITCRSNLWQNLSIDGRLDARSLKGSAHIELSRFQPHRLADRLLARAGIACSESILYLRADVQTDGLQKFRGEVKSSIPKLTLSRNNETSLLQVENLGITFSVEGDKTELSLDQLKLDYPRLSMSGTFSMDKAVPQVRLDLEARDMDVDAARKVALCLGGNVRLVRKIFDYVRGGEIPVITFHSLGNELDQLGKNEAFRIEGRLRDGKIHIKGPGLDPEEVNGEVVIAKGILEGKDLEARLGNSRGNQGRLRVGLKKGKDAPFHLDLEVDADLGEVQPILLRVIKHGTFVRELSLVDNIDGRVQGRLTLGESLHSVAAKVDVSQCTLSAHYKRIPYSIRIESGQVFYETDSIKGRNVNGTLGSSSFSGLTCRVGFGDSPRLEIESGQFRLLMDEIYPWLMSYESIRKDLEVFKDVKGRIELTGMHLDGPVSRPADWDFVAKATVENLTVATRLCPEPVQIASGRLSATPEELSFNDVNARLLDAPIGASGTLFGYLTGLAKADVDMNGTIGSEAFKWVADDVVHLPPTLDLRTPFPLANAKLVWNRGGETSFKGDFGFPKGVKGSLDLVRGPRTFMLNRLSIQDRNSRTTFSITRTRRSLGLKFTGTLSGSTLDKIFLTNVAPHLRIRGDFLLNVRLDKPAFSKTQGHLEAKDLTIPYSWLAPIRIDSLSLDASEKGIRVDPSRFTLEKSHISLQGDLGFAPEGIQVDMDLASHGIAWDTIERVIDRAKAEKPADEEAPSSWPRIQGTVRCRTESFTYGQFTWKPLYASVTFSPDDLRVAVTEADICGIWTLGAINLDGGELSLDFRLITKDGDLEPTFPCLSDTERQVTGKFDLSGDIKGTARGDAVIRALKGNLEFSARSGNILKDPVLAKVFSVLNVTEILRGKMPDLRSDQLPYDSLTVKADLRDGTLVLNEAVLSGPTVGIVGSGTVYLIDKKVDLKLIVAPLRTVDFIVERTPIVKNIMGGKLITVPVRISGDWRDPEVTMLSAAAVGSRLLGIMKNTLLLPIELVEPVLPKQDEEGGPP